MDITSASQLLDLVKERKQSLSQVVAEYEAFRSNTSCEAVREQMRETLKVMRASVENGILDKGERTHIITGYGHLFKEAIAENRVLGCSLLKNVVLYALAVGQHNAGLGRIVACPTAGACGVVPGAMLAVADELDSSEEELIEALLVMGGVGIVSAAQGPISGAEGGCQSECGVASSMAAGAVVYLMGGSGEQVFAAASLALQSHLGLVCDPLASLVEVPCVTRNSTSATTAIVAANMAMAGIPAVIPYDECVVAMKQIGKSMPESLCETSKGGLAASPTGRKIYDELRQKHSQ
ncbi:MAG: L-serine ammonia-lyase, iron-sulfur-dependent, subunit alpha [Firmicutes bacterium]|nr:L-serine ammonia-lyase, iron-sulfur-dependent, subunit alpha [Bacillota bacterium]